jgi:signal transduction histidine kinase
MVVLVFLLVSLSMLAYYRYSILEGGERSVRINREILDRISAEISQGISSRFPDGDQINRYIQNAAQKDKINIYIYDPDKKLVYQAESQENKMFEINSYDFVTLKGQAVYLVETQTSFNVKDILGASVLGSFILFALTILSLILLLLVVYLHFDIIKPLSLLQKSFGLVGYRKNQFSSLPLNRNDEIGDLSAGFESMVHKLQDSSNQQLEMISSISHDLKTPLTSIKGYMERLLVSNIKCEEKRQEYYRIIFQKAEDVQKLLEDFLGYTNNEAECTKLKQEKVSLRDFFLSLCQEYTEELQVCHTDFSYCYLIPEHSGVMIDIGKIRRVIANLISNSIKHAGTPLKITIACTVEKEFTTITVEDNGKGVPENDLDNIFDKFFRADKSRSPETGGTGLGLAISKSIVESHGGKILAFNKPISGFGISFTLPLVKEN